jgi:hypothetical protein
VSDTVASVKPGRWARRAAENVRAELARHGLLDQWAAERLGMGKSSFSGRVRPESRGGPTVGLEVEEVGLLAEAIAEHTGRPVGEVLAALDPFRESGSSSD